ncbi:hypothetical protein CWR48_01825 [Oceanobacillus arenosus]|uniref:LysM domain-containing protein n=1 Tax=Oceanobacillus arenosus TaxID=1229153 RepID=A0A3D8Q3V2_9BACI|nr:LysM domain-containing protein [Oceanobacillus arenosus]RDW22469.1 hypothetical protein CWR48_01825 [Oceanobacillus arenosus]
MENFFNYTILPGDNYWLLAQRYHTTAGEIFLANPGVNPYYPPIGQHISIPILRQRNVNYAQQSHCISQTEVDYRNDMRSLWEEHVAWTRMAIISLIFKLPDVDFVITRLLKNATDMGNMIRRLYGNVAAETYATLIKDHLLIAADLVKAALAGDQQKVIAIDKKWHENADDIAVFLNSINRFLTVEAVKEMFYHHLDLTKQEAVAMINRDYQKDIDVYDEIEKQAREMADAISDAMVKGYPSMF